MASTEAGRPVAELSGFRRDLLRVVASLDSPRGTEIKEAMEQAYRVQEIHSGRLYPNLDDLVDQGLVSKQSTGRSNQYDITDRGESVFHAHARWMHVPLEKQN